MLRLVAAGKKKRATHGPRAFLKNCKSNWRPGSDDVSGENDTVRIDTQSEGLHEGHVRPEIGEHRRNILVGTGAVVFHTTLQWLMSRGC